LDLEDQRAHIELTVKNEARKLELIRAINAQIVAEERRANQERENLVAAFYDKQRQELRAWADRVTDTLKTALSRFRDEGLKGFFASIGESFLQLLEQMALELLRSRVYELLTKIYKIPTVTSEGEASHPDNGGGGVLDTLLRVIGLPNPKDTAAASAPVVNAVEHTREQITSTVTNQINDSTARDLQAVDLQTRLVVAAIERASFAVTGAIDAQAQKFSPQNVFGAVSATPPTRPSSAGESPGLGGLSQSIGQLLGVTLRTTPDAAAISRAGQAATGAIKDGWERSKDKIQQTGGAQVKTLTGVGQSIVSTMLQIASVIASGQGRGSFWKGLLVATATGFVSGLTGGLFKDQSVPTTTTPAASTPPAASFRPPPEDARSRSPRAVLTSLSLPPTRNTARACRGYWPATIAKQVFSRSLPPPSL
jgi:hypothetical protein